MAGVPADPWTRLTMRLRRLARVSARRQAARTGSPASEVRRKFTGMEDELERERRRCVTICRRRAELWRMTLERSPMAGALEEARARANEAAYLADLLESGVDLAEAPAAGADRADA